MRVRRISDGKIFTSPDAVAKHLGIRGVARYVEGCCKGLWPDVEGEKYEWVYPTGEEEDIYAKSVAGVKSTPKTPNKYYKRRGKATNRAYRDFLWKVSGAVVAWRNLQSEDELLKVRVVGDFMVDLAPIYAELNNQNLDVPNYTLTRHFKAWAEVYEKIAGMRLVKVDSDRSTRQRHAVVFDLEIDENVTAYDEFPQYFSEKAAAGVSEEPYKAPPGPPGRKVVELTRKRIYQSIRHASEVTWASAKMITYCCNGDIKSIKGMGSELRFKYIENYKGSLKKFTEIQKKYAHSRRVSSGILPVIDKETGEEHRSIARACAETGVTRKRIKKECEKNRSGDGNTRFVYSDDFY